MVGVRVRVRVWVRVRVRVWVWVGVGVGVEVRLFYCPRHCLCLALPRLFLPVDKISWVVGGSWVLASRLFNGLIVLPYLVLP